MRVPPRSNHAFTLVELLVVTAIIALLIGILLPALARAQAASRAVVCLGNCKGLCAAMALHANDHDGRLCPHARWNRRLESSTGARGVNQEWCFADPVAGPPERAHEFGIMGDYLDAGGQALMCPDYQTPEDVLQITRNIGLAYPNLVHYGYNGLMLGRKDPNFNTLDQSADGYRTWIGYTKAAVPQPAKTVLFADTARRLAGRLLPQKDVLPPVDEFFADGSPRAFASPTAHGRHSTKATVAWLDGHASRVKPTIYPDQSEADRFDRLGYIAPPSTERDNAWMRGW